MLFSTALAFGALLTSVSAAPLLDVGAGVGLTLGSLNSCIFSDPLLKLSPNTNLALDLVSNKCLTVSACLAVKTNEIVTKSLLNGLVSLTINTCQKKTCPATLALTKDGLCACITGSIFSDLTKSSCIPKTSCTGLKVVSGSGSNAYCTPKTCPKTLTLTANGICVCASGLIYSNAKQTACIAISKCNTLLNDIITGVNGASGSCVSKKCPTGQLLHSLTGLCIEASLCPGLLNTIVTSVDGLQKLCKPKSCASGLILNLNTGVCGCPTDKIFGSSKLNTCISVGQCTSYNTVVNGVCLPKVSACLATELLDAKTQLCISADLCSTITNTITSRVCIPKVCKSGTQLNLLTGVCDLVCGVNQLLTPTKTKCIASTTCKGALNTILPGVGGAPGVCIPKTSCTGLGLAVVDGICTCGKGFSLTLLGICVAIL